MLRPLKSIRLTDLFDSIVVDDVEDFTDTQELREKPWWERRVLVTRFLDSSVFLHAYLVPRRKLNPREAQVEEKAKAIIARVDSGSEEVLTTVVHVAEIANIVKSRLGLQVSLGVVARLLSLENVGVVGVTREYYEEALAVANRYKVGINVALAYIKMEQHNIEEVYTFDKHFKNLPDTKIVQE